MKKTLLIVASIAMAFINFSQITHVISATPASTVFTPSDITVSHGDTIILDYTRRHPTVEVDSNTWANNMNTPLSGGITLTPGDTIIVDTNVITPGTHYYVCTIHVGGSGMKGKINVLGGNTVEINQNLLLNATVFPNPVINNLNVRLQENGKANVTIYDMAGKIVNNKTVYRANFSVDFSSFVKGTYVVNIEKNGLIYNETISKK